MIKCLVTLAAMCSLLCKEEEKRKDSLVSLAPRIKVDKRVPLLFVQFGLS